MFASALLIAVLAATSSLATPIEARAGADDPPAETVSLAMPIAVHARASQDSPIVQVCTGPPGVGCVNIPVVSSTCINFNQGLTFLNKEVTTVVVPDGYGCLTPPPTDVVLQGGTTNMALAVYAGGPFNFNDLASSFTCSPVF